MSLVLMLNASWALAHSLLYGFHVAALNGVQASVVCDGGGRSAKMGIHSCVSLTVSHDISLYLGYFAGKEMSSCLCNAT